MNEALLDCFSPDYFAARERFRAAAAKCGWRLQAYPITARGPGGEELTVDAAIWPGDGSERAIVVSSGLHGVEGFFGSAVQVGVLDRWAARAELAPPMRYVFVHGLNPYGFAWLRRWDEANVDPNRNFLLPEEDYAGSPAEYAELDGLLNPARPPSAWEQFTVKALFAVAQHGLPALKQAIAGGQYAYPRGLFFGGAGPSTAARLMAERLPAWLEGCTDVVHLDFHTGLGAWGTWKLLLDYAPTDEQRERLSGWFGPDSYESCDADNVSYDARGGFGRWCVRTFADRKYLFGCAEFGTYGPIRVLGGLRAENQSHHWGRADDRSIVRAKERLVELFCPASPEWRRKVVGDGIALVEQGASGLGWERRNPKEL